ncbi:DNA segregation ATPase FtsK/SpoIIIE, S-DNA-T family [Amycolatopsis sacchari]|uniref:DNA segregation ATPase FtsK/SpoIIIE, S-DNA-T family n=1 Tax=Amycolatopsis sacchari TaxID=115433 RepID=A0A1I4A9J7_9PSEU|nr:cell division protein FtsK [Amycolatopsis sacchari]SFK52459.1 DNA segregation ATPase FtsK/SpoIIIE, S-DNA-T family [Amycolatopsis sacchari]
MSVPADHPDRDREPDSRETMNTPEHDPVNTTPDTPVNPEPNDDVNGRVLPFTPRPDSAATPDEIPVQDRREVAPSEVLDAEIVDDEPARPPVPVDPPEVRRSWWEAAGEATARPLVAQWLTSWEEFRSRVRFLVQYALHVSAFHALRFPLYLLKAFLRSFGAARRLAGRLHAWVYDAESKPVRLAARDRADVNEYMKLRQVRNETVRKRLLPVWLGLLALAAVVYVCLACLPAFWNWTLLIGAMVVLGWWGAPADKPVTGRAVDLAKAPKLTSDAIVDALGALGIGELNKKLAKNPNAIGFPSPIHREGPGWRADIDLPLGVTAADVIERRPKLASGLRRQLGCVWPEADPAVHEGRLVLWVGNRDMSSAKQAPWPLAKAGRVDLFKPQPFGTDQRGRWVEQTLMYVSGVIGAIPRMGKTVTVREILLIAALDPRSELHVYDLKGTGDLSPFEPVAHRYGVGDDADQIESAVVAMREVREEMRRRTKVLRELPDDVCPDSRVEPHLVDNPKLGLKPIVIGVDECQVWFEHPKHGAELEDICTDLVKRGPATGIMLFLATQRPDSKSIPTGISANASFRFCLKVMGQVENDMVLGTSSYQAGIRATTFAWNDKGIGYLRGEGSDARIVRGVYTDKPGAKKIVARARAMRQEVGNITGYAAGQDIDATLIRGSAIEDAISVFADGEDRLWSDTLIARLAEVRPEYADYTPDTLAAALKPYGVTPKQVAMTDVDGTRRNRRGYRLADLRKAQTTHQK